jgi:hydrogenase nickel incorporation protein HypA/HybF
VHEFSLAQGLVRQLDELADRHKAEKILTVTVTVGSMSGIVVDSFVFGFEVLAKEHPLTNTARLEIIRAEPALDCLACGYGIVSQTRPASCPQCGSRKLRLSGGDELILTQVEME